MQSKLITLTANWNVSPKVKTIITTRFGGFSKPPYDNFNLANHVNDNLEDVIQNRSLLAQLLPTPEVTWLNQTHSNAVIKLDSTYTYNNTPCDASYTSNPQTICAVLTADCLPILLTNTEENFVAAIHAGWKGVANGIIANTIKTINTDPTQIKAFIGPSITQQYFQVGEDVKHIFCNLDQENSQFFVVDITEQGKYLCDIIAIAKQQLLKIGLLEHNISISQHCTYQNPDFYSYRQNNVTGRFASLIWLDTASKF